MKPDVMQRFAYRPLIIASSYMMAIAACTRSGTAVGEQSPQSPVPILARDSTLSNFSPSTVFGSGELTYEYSSVAVIRAVGDSLPRTDSIETTALLATTFQATPPRQSIRVTTRIDSLVVRPLMPNAQSPSTSSQQSQSYASDLRTLEIDPTTGRIISHDEPSTCTQDTRDAILRGDEVLPRIPQQRARIRSWSDTTSRQLCRGGLQLEVSQVAHYDLLTTDDTVDAQLIRSVESRLAGKGVQWRQPVEATGHATAIDTFFISRSTNRIERVASNSQTEINFQSSRRNQRFTQSMSTRIQRRQ